MKNTIIKVWLASVMLLGFCQVYAQKERKISREELAIRQAEYIAHSLALEKDVAKQFMEAFCQFQSEIWALGPRLSTPQTDEETNVTIEQRLERSQHILDIRKKYYKIYSNFLTQKQMERVFEMEREMRNRLLSGKKSVKKGQRKNR